MSIHFTKIDKMPLAEKKRRAADTGEMSSRHREPKQREPDASTVKLEEKVTQIKSHLREAYPVTPAPITIRDHRTVLAEGGNNSSSEVSTRRKHGHVPTLVLACSDDNGQGSARPKRHSRKATLTFAGDARRIDNKGPTFP